MSTHKLHYKEQGETFGFVNQQGDWVIEPVYSGGDKEFTNDMYCVVLEKYVGEGIDEHTEFHLVNENGSVLNLSNRFHHLEEATGFDTTNELIRFLVNDEEGLYSYTEKKVILKPIASSIDKHESGLIYFEADGSRIMNVFEDSLVIVENDYGYIDKYGSFILNKGIIKEKLKHDCYILETDGGPNDMLYAPSEDDGEHYNSGNLISDIEYYSISESGDLLEITKSDRNTGIYNLEERKWEFKPR